MDVDISQYLNIFVEEAKENLQSMNEVLLELEKNPSHLGHINEIFRVAHTIKGMAGTMGFHNMANLTHEMENLLQVARSNEIKLTQDVIDILFECFDAIDISVTSVLEYGSEDENMNKTLINKLAIVLNKEEYSNEDSITHKDYIKMDSYIIDIIEKAKTYDLIAYKIDFELSEFCMLKAARAFIIFNTLEDLGEIIHSNPSVEDIEDEEFELIFSVIMISDKNESILTKRLSNISEVKSLDINVFDYSNAKYIIEEDEEYIENDNTNESDKSIKNRTKTKTNSGKLGKTVRVDIGRLDNLINLVSELIIIKTRMDNLSENSNVEDMTEAIEYLDRITTNLHDAVMKVRMVPIEKIFNRFPRLVRDLSKELNKEIQLEISGEKTEVDRTIIDEIGNPLIHLIRNSIDHGIELPSERVESGKNEMGTILLKSYPDGNNVVIEVEDDGKGIDHEMIKKKAIEKGIISYRDAKKLTIEDSINLLFEAGFSTTEVVSDVSGRGVGLDVVKSKIESINGNIEVDSVKGRGSKFIIRIPLTLAIIQALLVKLGEEIYAMPLSSVTEITNVSNDQIRDIQGQQIILYKGATLPIIRLNNILGIDNNDGIEDLIVVIVKKGDKQAGLIVDNLIGQQEIVIKSLGKYLSSVKYLSGSTILGNGNISLILDVNSLI